MPVETRWTRRAESDRAVLAPRRSEAAVDSIHVMAEFLIAKHGRKRAEETARANATWYPPGSEAFVYWQSVADAVRTAGAPRRKRAEEPTRGTATRYASRSEAVVHPQSLTDASHPAGVPEVIVKPGDTIAGLVTGAYGRLDYTLLDFAKLANPDVGDLNSIRVGQRLRFPRFEPSAMVQKGENGLYMVHLLTVWDTSNREFAQLREAVLEAGRTISVVPVRLTAALGVPSAFPRYPEVYRVMVGDFPDREQAETFYRTFQGRSEWRHDADLLSRPPEQHDDDPTVPTSVR
ncbi:MAG: LysM peptidoglycan-binding domain-containing protein [Candidatus Rokuibacteriota bacterium]